MTDGPIIALDAMGGDFAPKMVLEGADLALVRHPSVRFQLFGDAERLRPILDGLPRLKLASTVHHTSESVSGSDKPAQTLRNGRQTSMWLAIESVQGGRAEAVVSAGNTGALMA